MLRKRWLGKVTNPGSPAGIISKLGHNLFTTKGLKATAWERTATALQEEGVKQLLTIIGVVLGALVLAWLGLKDE